MIALGLCMCSCTRSFDISVALREDIPVFRFYQKGLISSKKIQVCVWLAEVIDNSGDSVIRIRPATHDACVPIDGLDLSALESKGFDVSIREPLKPKSLYHLEVTAQEGVGRSRIWTQPGG